MSKPESIPQERLEVFERYLFQRMQPDERQEFEAKLAGETEWARQFAEFREYAELVEELNLREALESYHGQVGSRGGTPPARTWRRKAYMIAASLAVFLSVGAWLLTRQSPNEKLFREHFVPDPGLPTVMGHAGEYDFYEAMVDYKRGNYREAIGKWEPLYKARPENDTLNYFLGAAELARENPRESLAYFQVAIQSENSYFRDDAYFYLGMAHLKLGNLPQAKQYLSKSSNPRANDLLRELND
ncbi:MULTISPECIES: tetratricopeptide repeat protein [unclassified Robiginitalea]|uniref:tetratricopeptide repeat protein n=1 Tax=Robiginitalea TaxID=252306 RepID=UPI0023490517|nr:MULTISPECIES: tetratricopeptide repeat protein [unclassified Robiginitalea]MDC6353611.1 tetratricopeptide repeat protein [Robiginitalea sp. PM2]MDC6373224.1 tetratricopeptide repeat protein [Robiginitalea sp. SP8]